MPHAEVNGLKLWYDRRGEGEPMLLLMGMSGSHSHWGPEFLDLLEGEGFELILYDHRGIGDSDPSPDIYSIADLADDAASVLDAIGIEQAHVLGLSMGGMVAQELALRHPEKVRTLTLAGTTPGGSRSEQTPQATVERFGSAITSGSEEEVLRAAWDLNVSAPFAADLARWEAFRMMSGETRVPRKVVLDQLQAITGHDTLDRLEQVSAPTLVLHGTDDQMLPAANARLIAARIPGADLHLFEDAGHVFMWEHPEESARLVASHARSGATASSSP
jgi:3-oxoadipate enol-lactonase